MTNPNTMMAFTLAVLVSLWFLSCDKPKEAAPDEEQTSKTPDPTQKTDGEDVVDATLPVEVVGKDGAPMDLVPAGPFIMGSPDGVGKDDEHPEHEVYLDAFYIDRYEVTVERYEKCVVEGGCRKENYQPREENKTCNFGDPERKNYPMNCVNWFGMQEYCEWAEKRLPTESEWEKAARGTDGRTYPWGEAEPTCELAHTYDCREEDVYPCTSPVGTVPKGKGPYGSHNLSANVMEWCNDFYDKQYYARSPAKNPSNETVASKQVYRGGACNGRDWMFKVTSRGRTDPLTAHYTLGGRCVKNP